MQACMHVGGLHWAFSCGLVRDRDNEYDFADTGYEILRWLNGCMCCDFTFLRLL